MVHYHELKIDALTFDEKSYFLGLFLADGCSFADSGGYHIKFSFQGNEGELAQRVLGLLKRLGLNPSM
jgi:DNA-binding transcriptional regulator WhiA